MVAQSTRTTPAPYDQAARLLGDITHGAPPTHFQEFRGVGDGRHSRSSSRSPESRPAIFHSPYRWDGVLHCYYGLAPRSGRRGTKDAIAVAGCCWGDEITKPPPDYLPSPSIMVLTSPRKAHTIWLLDKYTAALDRVETINAKIAVAQGGDIVHNRDRVFRLPGFQNIKPQYFEKPWTWLVEFHTDRRYVLEELEEALTGIELAKTPAPLGTPRPHGPLPTAVQTRLEEYLGSSGLTRQSNSQYRGPCLFHPCNCERALVVTPASGLWCCWCSDHPKINAKAYVAGGSKSLLELAGIVYSPHIKRLQTVVVEL